MIKNSATHKVLPPSHRMDKPKSVIVSRVNIPLFSMRTPSAALKVFSDEIVALLIRTSVPWNIEK